MTWRALARRVERKSDTARGTEEVYGDGKMVPVEGVEPPTFALRIALGAPRRVPRTIPETLQNPRKFWVCADILQMKIAVRSPPGAAFRDRTWRGSADENLLTLYVTRAADTIRSCQTNRS